MTFLKDPHAVLDYTIDWTRWLGGDTIATSEWLVPAELTLAAHTKTISSTTIWLSSGTAGESYTVTNRISTDGGRTEDRSFTVRVEER
jgi:hypothetical protein